MAALLVALAVMSVVLTVALPVWRQMVQREREDELIFRGQQYARAIGLFQRKFGPTFPPNLDVLVDQRLLRQKYKDPVNGWQDFEILYQGSLATAMPGQGGGGSARPGISSGPGSGPSSSLSGSTSPAGQSRPGGQTQAGAGLSGAGGRSQSGPGLQLGPGSAAGLGGQRGGIVGVASKSTAKSIKIYNGRTYYNEWQFVFLAAGQAGMGGAGLLGGIPGQPRGPGSLPPVAMGGAGSTGGRQRGGQQGPFGPGQRGGQRGLGPGGSGSRGPGTGGAFPSSQPTGRRGGQP